MRKVHKTLNLRLELVERLEEEENQSAVVNELLAEYYGVDYDGD